MASSLLLFLQRDENFIDVREYVIALSVVCRPAKTLETMKLAFKVRSFPWFFFFNGIYPVATWVYVCKDICFSCLHLHFWGNTCISLFLACSMSWWLLFHADLSWTYVTLTFRSPYCHKVGGSPKSWGVGDIRDGTMTSFASSLSQMFEAEEDGAITQMELAVILKTALGVTHLGVSQLFNAIDAGDTGKITFGEWMKGNFHLNVGIEGAGSWECQTPFSPFLHLWRPPVVSPQISSEALLSWTLILPRTSCMLRTQPFTVEAATITKQRPARLPWTHEALPPSNWATASAPTLAPTTTWQQTDFLRNTTERHAGLKWRPLLVRGGPSCMRVMMKVCTAVKG